MAGVGLHIGAGGGSRSSNSNSSFGSNNTLQCHSGGYTEAVVVFSTSSLGIGTNLILMSLILSRKELRT